MKKIIVLSAFVAAMLLSVFSGCVPADASKKDNSITMRNVADQKTFDPY